MTVSIKNTGERIPIRTHRNPGAYRIPGRFRKYDILRQVIVTGQIVTDVVQFLRSGDGGVACPVGGRFRIGPQYGDQKQRYQQADKPKLPVLHEMTSFL